MRFQRMAAKVAGATPGKRCTSDVEQELENGSDGASTRERHRIEIRT